MSKIQQLLAEVCRATRIVVSAGPPGSLPALAGRGARAGRGVPRCVPRGLVVVALLSCGTRAGAQVVQKVVEPFESAAWNISDDSSATGNGSASTDVPAELAGASTHSLDFQANFSGTGFEFFKGGPPKPLVIPGVTKRLSMWVHSDGKYGWVMQFNDGWGRAEAGGKLDWEVTRGAGTTWKKMTFEVPAGWVQPLSITGMLAHNWDSKTVKASGHLLLDQLQVETDITNVDPVTGLLAGWTAPPPGTGKNLFTQAPLTPLLNVDLAGSESYNVFSAGAPQFTLTARNWRAAPAAGTLAWKVTDRAGATLQNGTLPLNVTDYARQAVTLNTFKYGVYNLETALTWADGKTSQSSQPFALIPDAKPLSDAEKDASPYGLNVMSARQPMVSTFRKAGIVWFRDYGFDWSWMERARGADNKFGGWPYYPKIVKMYDDAGARVLATLKTSIVSPKPGGTNAPDLNWTRELASVLTAFPSLQTYELDNEYDLNGASAAAETAMGWKNYNTFHKKFGDVTNLLSDGQFTAVENGRAGIWPDRLRASVQSGAYANINVVNSHHYAGLDAPELNSINYNTGMMLQGENALLFDQLRAAKRAGSSDGKARQHWLTEFGWDTKAGPVVSADQQAAYLARGFMLLQAAGTSKGFWFWDLDSDVANNFFDGCGLFTHDQKPKLSYAAYAGMTQLLPKPQFLGLISAGDNTWGYLFRNEGKLVATLWTLDGTKGPSVNFGDAKVYDMFANPTESTVALGMEPVYAVGVAEDSRWAHQAAYSLDSRYLVNETAGDSVTTTLQIQNTRATAINAGVSLQLPAGCTDVTGAKTVTVAAGATQLVPLTFKIDNAEPLGEKRVGVAVSEGEPLTTIPLRVQIGRPILMTVTSLRGEPGTGAVKIRVANRSAVALDGALTFKLPASWSIATPQIPVQALAPGEVREIPASINWTPNWKAGEAASVEYRSVDNRTASQPIIPPRLVLAAAPTGAGALKMDGDLKDWPAAAKIPDWVLGATQGVAQASVYAAWSPQGIYLAAEVHDSKGRVPDPKAFWAGDALELFLDTHASKTPRQYAPGDHQFWFVPLFEEKRVYAGQWKRGTEIPAIAYDLHPIQSAAVRHGDGYIIECLLPAALIQGFKPEAGAQLGLNFNLTVRGARNDREVFWSVPKSEGTNQPASWGTVTLGRP